MSIEHNRAKLEPISPKPNLVNLEFALRKEFKFTLRKKIHLGRSEYCLVQTQQFQESNPIPIALEQGQEKAET